MVDTLCCGNPLESIFMPAQELQSHSPVIGISDGVEKLTDLVEHRICIDRRHRYQCGNIILIVVHSQTDLLDRHLRSSPELRHCSTDFYDLALIRAIDGPRIVPHLSLDRPGLI